MIAWQLGSQKLGLCTEFILEICSTSQCQGGREVMIITCQVVWVLGAYLLTWFPPMKIRLVEFWSMLFPPQIKKELINA